MTDKLISIAVVTEPFMGGVSRQLNLLLQYLQEDFHFSFAVGSWRSNGLDEFADQCKISGADIEIINMHRAVHPVSDSLALVKLTNWLRKTRPQLVHVHAAKAGAIGRIAAFITGIPCIYTPHLWSFANSEHGKKARLFRLIEKNLAKVTAATIVLTPEQAAEAQAINYSGQLICIKNGVDCKRFTPLEETDKKQLRQHDNFPVDAFLVAVAARNSQQKDMGIILEIADILKQYNLTAQSRPIIICVAGTYHDEELQQIAKDKALPINWLGILPADYMPQFYQKVDSLLLTSRWEGMPYVLLEASASALPCLATDIPGNRAVVIDQKTGYLYPTGQAKEFADSLIRLANNQTLQQQLGNAARQYMLDQYDINPWVVSMREIYHKYAAKSL